MKKKSRKKNSQTAKHYISNAVRLLAYSPAFYFTIASAEISLCRIQSFMALKSALSLSHTNRTSKMHHETIHLNVFDAESEWLDSPANACRGAVAAAAAASRRIELHSMLHIERSHCRKFRFLSSLCENKTSVQRARLQGKHIEN